MSDQRRFRDYGARHQHIAAKLFGLLQGVEVVIAWPHGAHAGDAACRGVGNRQHIFCQTLNRSILLNLCRWHYHPAEPDVRSQFACRDYDGRGRNSTRTPPSSIGVYRYLSNSQCAWLAP